MQHQEGAVKNAAIFQHRILSSELESDLNEVYRYAGIFSKDGSASDPQLLKLSEDAVKEVRDAMNPRSVYIRFPLTVTESDQITYDGKSLYDIEFGDVKFSSHYLGLNLQDCNSIYLFAATLGPAVDKAIQKASRINAAKAVMLQEMSTSGVAMAVTVTLAWLACTAVSSMIMKKSTDEKGESI